VPGGSRAPASAKLLVVDLIAEHDSSVVTEGRRAGRRAGEMAGRDEGSFALLNKSAGRGLFREGLFGLFGSVSSTQDKTCPLMLVCLP
jgi:hypothetical protein